MKLTIEQKDEIKSRFHQTKNIDQFSELLQWIYDTKFPKGDAKITITITVRDLNYYAFKKTDRYITFQIPKKDKTKTRFISSPHYKLKVIQKCINELLNAVFIPHKNAHGFIPNKSVVSNATSHIKKNFVYNIDIDNFFPSTEFRRVKTVLELNPFSLNGNKEQLAFLIANLCCEKIKFVKNNKEIEISGLPQGAPTSPTLTNIVCQRLDRRLTSLAKSYGASYSRYADDITFSAHSNIFTKWFKARLKVIIERQENFKINLEKERLQDWNKRQVVTGLIVNQKSNVNRDYIKDIRFWLNCWEKKGIEPTKIIFKYFFPHKKGYLRYNGAIITFQNYLRGKILYLGMVRGQEDSLYKNLFAKFTALAESRKFEETGIDLNQILAIWEQNGIEAAMHYYFELSKNNGTQ